MLWLHAVLLFGPFQPLPCQVSDIYRFPPPIHQTTAPDEYQSETFPNIECPAIDARMAWLEANRAMLLREVAQWDHWDEQIAEQRRIEWAWAPLFRARWAVEHCKDPDLALHYLSVVRERIGEEAYIAGRMPNPVPLSRYSEIPR